MQTALDVTSFIMGFTAGANVATNIQLKLQHEQARNLAQKMGYNIDPD